MACPKNDVLIKKKCNRVHFERLHLDHDHDRMGPTFTTEYNQLWRSTASKWIELQTSDFLEQRQLFEIGPIWGL